MKRSEIPHRSEQELLMHLLDEELLARDSGVSRHLQQCHKCSAVLQGYKELLSDIRSFTIKDVSHGAWQEQKDRVMAAIKVGGIGNHQRVWPCLKAALARHWEYALANPLPTLGCIALVIAFASQETISIFRLDRMLPNTGDVIRLIKQVL
jgi:hypothetical protein